MLWYVWTVGKICDSRCFGHIHVHSLPFSCSLSQSFSCSCSLSFSWGLKGLFELKKADSSQKERQADARQPAHKTALLAKSRSLSSWIAKGTILRGFGRTVRVCPGTRYLSIPNRLCISVESNIYSVYIRADDKKGHPPPPKNVDKKGDTAFRRPRGFRRNCGCWHQSNGPAGCMRFHGCDGTALEGRYLPQK